MESAILCPPFLSTSSLKDHLMVLAPMRELIRTGALAVRADDAAGADRHQPGEEMAPALQADLDRPRVRRPDGLDVLQDPSVRRHDLGVSQPLQRPHHVGRGEVEV